MSPSERWKEQWLQWPSPQTTCSLMACFTLLWGGVPPSPLWSPHQHTGRRKKRQVRKRTDRWKQRAEGVCAQSGVDKEAKEAMLLSHPFSLQLSAMCFSQGLLKWQRIHLLMQEMREMQVNPWVRKIPWRRAWQPTPVFLPGKFHGQRSLAGYSL